MASKKAVATDVQMFGVGEVHILSFLFGLIAFLGAFGAYQNGYMYFSGALTMLTIVLIIVFVVNLRKIAKQIAKGN